MQHCEGVDFEATKRAVHIEVPGDRRDARGAKRRVLVGVPGKAI